MEDYCDSIIVEHWSTHNDEMKANYAEHIINTLKSSPWNYMRKVKRYRYVNMLQDMVKLYNDMLHRTIGMKPSEVTKGHVERRLWLHQYKPKESYEKSKQLCKVPFAFKKGNHMCISHKAQMFQWGHDKSGPEKYLKFINLLCAWECANIISTIYKGRT